MRPSDFTGYEEGLVFTGCAWRRRAPDACPCCAGAHCCLCSVLARVGDLCEHDSLARHYAIPAGYREPEPG